jgi:hypothetical protein
MGIDPAPSFSERHVSSGSYTDLGIRTLYHATNSSAAHSILTHVFRWGSSGYVGLVIYFAVAPPAARHKLSPRNGTDVVLQAADVHLGCAYAIRNGVSRGVERSLDHTESVFLPNDAGVAGADLEYERQSTNPATAGSARQWPPSQYQAIFRLSKRRLRLRSSLRKPSRRRERPSSDTRKR